MIAPFVLLLMTAPGEAPVAADAIILAGDPRAEVAQTQHEALVVRAREMRARGVALASRYPGVLSSEKLPGLKPGFVVVLAGLCPAGQGAAVVRRLKKMVPGTYHRRVKVPRAALSCPELSKETALVDEQWIEAHLGPGRHGAADVARMIRASNWVGESGELQWGPDVACWALYGTSCQRHRDLKAGPCGPGTTTTTPPTPASALCRDDGTLSPAEGTWIVIRTRAGDRPAWFVPDEGHTHHQLHLGKSNRDVACFEDSTFTEGPAPTVFQDQVEHRLTCLARSNLKMVDLALDAGSLKPGQPAARFPADRYRLKQRRGSTLLCTEGTVFRLQSKRAWEIASPDDCD